MSDLYPEPQRMLPNRCAAVRASDTRVAVDTAPGVPLEIEFLDGVGWSFELRYDLLGGGRIRQPFTGQQEAIGRRALSLEQSGDRTIIEAGKVYVTIDTRSGSFECGVSQQAYFRTEQCPFFSHPEGVEILDEIQSFEHPGFEEQTPWRPVPIYLKTTMARFRYPAPHGPILGLPGQTGEFNRKGYRFELFNNDQPAHVPSRPPMYQSWPIIIHRGVDGDGWVGVFHDNPARTFVDLGDFYKESVVFESITNNTRVYLVHAATLPGITEKFVRLLGQPVFPPAWAFGYQQCRYSYMSTEEIRQVARRFREERIPCDAIYFDIDYMEGYRVFTRDPDRFGDLHECLDELHVDGFKAVCIVDPGVKIDPGYPAYERLKGSDGFLKDREGNDFEIVCWPGKAALPDFLSPEPSSLWVEMQREWLAEFRFDGVWNDMNEPSNFDGGRQKTNAAFTASGPITPLYNLYGAQMAEASAAGWRGARPDERGLVISRSGYPGVQRHAVIWHGDNYAWWEHLRLAVDTAVTYSLCGAFYTGPDVPGFFGNPADDLAVRFFQLGAFLPLFRGHSYKLSCSKEPYVYGGEAGRYIRSAIELRYSLMTEWYSNFERCVRMGYPPLEPIFDDTGAPLRDSFLLFDKFLVVAVTNRDERMRAVWLPKGRWYRLGETMTSIEGGRWLAEPITLERIPVFVRAGSIVVRNTIGRNVATTLGAPEKRELYFGEDGSATGYLFRDDGLSANGEGASRFKLSVRERSETVFEQEISG